EAAVLGLAGSAVGIPLGIGLAYLSLQPVQRILSDMLSTIDASQVHLTLGVLLLALAAGEGTALAAVAAAALIAAGRPPGLGARPMPRRAAWGYRALQALASGLLAALGVVCILLRGQLPLRLGIYGGLMLVFVAALLATPLLAALLARLLLPLGRRCLGIEGRL